jgi:hypothetical protein
MPIATPLFAPLLGGAASPYPFSSSPVRAIADCVFAMVPAWTYNSSAEVDYNYGATAAESLGSTVGQADDYSPSGHYIASASGAAVSLAAPTTTSGQQVAYSFNGSSGFMSVRYSTKSYKPFWSTGVGTIAIWIEPTSVSGTGQIINNNDDSESNPGFMLRRDTTGLMFKLCRNAAGTIGEKSLTSVLSNNVGGWCIIRFNGNGATGKMRFGGGADQAFSLNSARFVTNDATQNITIGAKTGGSQKFTGYIGPCLMFSRSISDAECTQIESWNPSLTNANPYSYSSGDITTASVVRSGYLLYNSAYLSTGTDRTALVTPTNGDPIKLAVNYSSQLVGFDLSRDLVAFGATDPKFTTGVISAACVRFNNGVATDDLKITSGYQFMPSRHHTHIVVVRNLDATYGSHTIRQQGALNSYYTIVGTNYSTGTNPRTSYHNSTGSGPGGSGIRGESQFNTLVVTKGDGAYYEYANGTQIATSVTGGALRANAIGGNNATAPDTSAWSLDGYVTEVYELPFEMTASQVAAFTAYIESNRIG